VRDRQERLEPRGDARDDGVSLDQCVPTQRQ
jgi:hypothetical protein